MSNDREQYRISGFTTGDLCVGVSVESEPPTPAEILNLSAGGIALSLQRDPDPVFSLGETVFVHVSSPHLTQKVVMPSLVYHRTENEESRVYGLKFVDWLKILSNLPAPLQALFNRRSDQRFEPDPERPVELKVHGTTPRSGVDAVLRDFSRAGLSFRAPLSAEAVLSKTESVRISFRLPTGSGKEVEFCGSICRRELLGVDVCYGVYFDEEKTPGFEKNQEALEEYIAELESAALLGLEASK